MGWLQFAVGCCWHRRPERQDHDPTQRTRFDTIGPYEVVRDRDRDRDPPSTEPLVIYARRPVSFVMC